MFSITPDPERSLRVSTLAELDFSVAIQESAVVLNSGGSSEVTIADAVYQRDTSATARIDGLASATPIVGFSNVHWSSLNEALATVDQSGKITATGSGMVGILARSGTLTRRVNHNARTEGPVQVDTLSRYTEGTLGRAIVDAGLADRSTGDSLQIFSARDDVAATYTRNGELWSGTNLAGCSVWNSTDNRRRGGALISPSHVLFCHHSNFFPANGATIRWVDADGPAHDRSLTNSVRVGTTDIRIGVVDVPLPESIPFYHVLPANWRDSLATVFPARLPIISLNQTGEAIARDMTGAGSGSISHQTASTLSKALVVGDSGQPNLVLIGGQTVLLGAHFNASNFPHVADNISAINAAMTTLGGGYQLTTVDLSAYPTFND